MKIIKQTQNGIGYLFCLLKEKQKVITRAVKFLERVGIKTVKPRCVLVFGRSNDWNDEQKEAYRILNASYHSLSIITYDHVLDRAKRILGIKQEPTQEDDVNPEDIPF